MNAKQQDFLFRIKMSKIIKCTIFQSERSIKNKLAGRGEEIVNIWGGTMELKVHIISFIS